MRHFSVADSSRNMDTFVSPRHDVSRYSASRSPSVVPLSRPHSDTPREYPSASSTATRNCQDGSASLSASGSGAIRQETRVRRVGAGRGEGIPLFPTAPPHPPPKLNLLPEPIPPLTQSKPAPPPLLPITVP